MPYPSQMSALVVSVNQCSRIEVSDRLRKAGAVVVEAMTVKQAEAVMRQLRFEFIFVNFHGTGIGMLDFLEIVRTMDPVTRVFVFGPHVDCHPFEELTAAGLTNLGFGNTPDSMRDILSAKFEEAGGQRSVGRHSQVMAKPRSRKPNGRSE